MSLSQIYDIESAVMSGSKDILNRNGITAVPVQRDSGDLTTPRVELQVSVTGPTNYLIQSGSAWFHGKFTGQLNAVVVTNRVENPTSHSVYTANTMALLSQYDNYNTGSGMPYHYMGRIYVNNVVSDYVSDKNTDLTAMNFPFEIWVKNGAL
jgi:hypothetical protein